MPTRRAETEPLFSSVESLKVASVSVTLPDVGIVTGLTPAVIPKSPLVVSSTLTPRGDVGAGLEVTVKTTLSPSVTSEPPVMPTSGSVLRPPDTVSVNAPVCPVAAVVASIVYVPAASDSLMRAFEPVPLSSSVWAATPFWLL